MNVFKAIDHYNLFQFKLFARQSIITSKCKNDFCFTDTQNNNDAEEIIYFSCLYLINF